MITSRHWVKVVSKTLYRTLYCEYYVIDFEIIVRDSRIGKPSLCTTLLLLPKQTITCPLIIELEWVMECCVGGVGAQQNIGLHGPHPYPGPLYSVTWVRAAETRLINSDVCIYGRIGWKNCKTFVTEPSLYVWINNAILCREVAISDSSVDLCKEILENSGWFGADKS